MKNIKLYSKRTIFIMIAVLMLVISTVSYTLSTLTDADKKVKQDITDFSRGAYDILIRPAGAQTDLEKQGMAIARALMNDPQLILCDEPTGSLDLDNRNQVMDILQEIHQKGGTIVLVTYDPELAVYGDLHFGMRDGQIFDKAKKVI